MLEIIVNLSFVLRYGEIMRHLPLLSIVEQLRLIREKEKWISPIFSFKSWPALSAVVPQALLPSNIHSAR
jgi:hypothetical protein